MVSYIRIGAERTVAMVCPYCGGRKDRVVDSRESREGDVIRRRRQCLQCERRRTTYERTEAVPLMVVKKDGRRERFDRSKLLGGLLKACEKRPVSTRQMEEIIDEVERQLNESPDCEIGSDAVGQHLMERLRQIDQVAFVRFASVYREFRDVKEFMREIQHLFGQ